MAANKKPRKKYRPRYPVEDYNPVAAGVAASRVFTDEEAAERIGKLADSIDRACKGTGEREDWQAILFAWNTVKSMAGIPGVMVNGRQACQLFGEVLLEIAPRYAAGVKALYPHERESFAQFMELYTALVVDVPLRIWAQAERKATIHKDNVRACIENEDAEQEAA